MHIYKTRKSISLYLTKVANIRVHNYIRYKNI